MKFLSIIMSVLLLTACGGGDNGPTEYNLIVNTTTGGSVNNVESSYIEGTDVALTATPTDGYVFSGWTGAVTSNESAITVTLNANTTLTANFSALYVVTATSATGGQVSDLNDNYLAGTDVTITATPETGYVFSNWTGDSDSTQNPLTLTVTAATNVEAVFKALFDVSVSASAGGDVSDIATQYADGTSVDITATANAGFTFTGWSGDVVSQDNPVSVTVTGDTSLTANFAPLFALSIADTQGGVVSDVATNYISGSQATITATPADGFVFNGWTGAITSQDNPLTLTINANTTLSANFLPLYTVNASASNGVISGIQDQYTSGTQATLTAVANSGFVFSNWSGAATGTNNPITFTVADNVAIEANFTALYSVTATAENGTISALDSTYLDGATVSISATANTGYVFTGWTGDITSTANPLSFDISQNTQVVANFEPTYTVTITSDNGVISELADRYNAGSVVALTATANDGFIFDTWSGDVTGTDNPINITVNADMNITANYVAGYQVTLLAGPNGTVNTELNGTYRAGEQITIIATPNDGYLMEKWENLLGNELELQNTFTIDVNADVQFKATFTTPGQHGQEVEPVTEFNIAVFPIIFADSPADILSRFPTPSEIDTLLTGSDSQITQYLDKITYSQFTLSADVFAPSTHQANSIVSGAPMLGADVIQINTINITGFNADDYDLLVYMPLSDVGQTVSFVTKTSGLIVNGEALDERSYMVAPIAKSECYGARVPDCNSVSTQDNLVDKFGYLLFSGANDVEGNVTWDLSQFEQTFIHELFHAIAIGTHANSSTNGTSRYFDTPVANNGNYLSYEYGNLFDIIGKGTFGASLNVGYRDAMGWIADRKVKITTPSTQTITFFPINSATGTTAIEVRIPEVYALGGPAFQAALFGYKNEGIYIELRSADDPFDLLDNPLLAGNSDGVMINLTDGYSTSIIDASPSANIDRSYGVQVDLQDVVLKPGMSFTHGTGKIVVSNVVANGDGSYDVTVELLN